ncbi:hypothetical protein, partial [Mesorhizobium sp. M4B.F.Ca.ET.215.01.1.1]|uniref:hypothetical protein n=1 Tax=Mesorhizobium sp. M4B.F.Ca.ET.215.01.1.1 TaxID=2563956 RepID=UPI001FDEEDAB
MESIAKAARVNKALVYRILSARNCCFRGYSSTPIGECARPKPCSQSPPTRWSRSISYASSRSLTIGKILGSLCWLESRISIMAT